MDTPGHTHITPDEAWQITCHEAGHAVVAVLYDFNVEFVERGDSEYGEMKACCCPLDYLDPNEGQQAWPLTEITKWQHCYAAGVAAEWLLFGQDRGYGYEVDLDRHSKLENLRPQRRHAGWNEDVQAVMKMLDRDAVEKVARAIHPKGRLDDVGLYGLFGKPPPWDRV